MLTGEAQCETREHQCTDYPVVAGGRNDDPEEHAEQGHAQCAYCLRRQQVAGNDAKGGSDRPARQGNGHGTVIVEWIQGTFAGNRDAENLVRDVKRDLSSDQFHPNDSTYEDIANAAILAVEKRF